jgi:hypothetical protein
MPSRKQGGVRMSMLDMAMIGGVVVLVVLILLRKKKH